MRTLTEFLQSALLSGIALSQVQHLAFGLVEPHQVLVGPLLQPVLVPLDGFPSLQCIDCNTQIGVICKLAEGALNSIVYVIGFCPDIEPLITTLWLKPDN